jgi:hypothetical protein
VIPADRKKFLEIVIGFAELKGKALSAPALELYWRAMQGWALEDFQAAAEVLLRTCEFMPTPKDFEDLRKAGRMTPGEAFSRAMEIARSCSPYRAATSGDACIDAAARACGGYFAMGQHETVKLGFLERAFTEHFATISDAQDTRDALPQLTANHVPKLSTEAVCRSVSKS